MRTPDDATLLAAWERAHSRRPVERPLVLLAVAAGEGWEHLLRLPIGRRDALLLELRGRLFGPHCACVARCPACAEGLEFDLPLDALRAHGPPAAPLLVETDGGPLPFRLPTSLDLAAAAGEPDPAQARRLLLGRCLEPGAPPAAALPDALTERIAEAMAAADPQAFVALALRCPACGHVWEPAFRIASFLWAELERWARRTLREVHQLARAYGWSEGEILAMGLARRRCYLELIAGE
jgi:hypothetical protein